MRFEAKINLCQPNSTISCDSVVRDYVYGCSSRFSSAVAIRLDGSNAMLSYFALLDGKRQVRRQFTVKLQGGIYAS